MPNLKRAPNERELEKLIALFLRAETDIINEIGRLRSLGLVDYHAVAALERVQAILRKLESDSWEYVPQMIEKQFYVRVPEARKILEPVKKHLAGYQNAAILTGEQHAVIDKLVMNLMGEIIEASQTVTQTLENALLGRVENDIYRRTGLETVAQMQAAGRGAYKMVPGFVEQLRREGVTAFVDKAGRKWSLHTYGSMVCRTTSRQAEVLAVLTADPGQDLYKISSHGTTCAICAPYEGRVYSKSGTDPDFPPLTAAFGKVDANGPDDLSNTWLNIHPNCLVPGGTILAEGVVAHSCREYDGPVITLETSRGNKITVTPNHPILTTEGFVPAGSLHKGSKIVETTGKYRFFLGKAPNNINVPTPVEQIAHSIIQTGGSSSIRVKSSPVQFHGDGSADGEVNIVFSDGFGVGEGNVLRSKPRRKHFFPAALFRRGSLFSSGSALQVAKRTLHSAHSKVSRSRFVCAVEGVTVQCKKLSHIGHGFAASFGNLRICKPLVMKIKKPLKLLSSSFKIARGDIKKFLLRFLGKQFVINHGSLDGVLGYSKMFRNLSVREPLAAERLQSLFRDNALVVSELLHVSTSKYNGKVYNLQTECGFYTYNSIVTHNCLHVLIPWTPAGRSEEEIQKIKDFSNPKKNPFTRDPRTQKQIEAYRKKEQARAKWLRDYRQWEQYRMTLGDKIPRTFQTFQKHKLAGDNRYKLWGLDYRRQLELLTHPERALPGAVDATAADAKFTQYLFGGTNERGLAKGRAFSSRLGYNMDNWERMRDEILTAAGKYPAILKREDIYGKRYEQQVILYGRKGSPANVLLAWNVPFDGKARLVTAYMQEA